MANKVNFYLGDSSSYDADTYSYGLYFTTDTNELFLNGSGIGPYIDSVEQTDSEVNITLKNGTTYTITAATTSVAGVFTAEQVSTLESLITSNSNILTTIASIIEDVQANAVSNSDSSITVNTTSDGTDIAVNISDSDVLLTIESDGVAANLSVIKSTTGLDSNVKEQYNIVGKNDTILGTIPIYKDSSLYSVAMGTTGDTVDSSTGVVTSGSGNDAVVFVYLLSDGTYELVAIDISEYLKESEFGDGLQVNDGVVSVLAEDDSIKVSENGIKVSGNYLGYDKNSEWGVINVVYKLLYSDTPANTESAAALYYMLTGTDSVGIIDIPKAASDTYGMITTSEVQSIVDASLTWTEI